MKIMAHILLIPWYIACIFLFLYIIPSGLVIILSLWVVTNLLATATNDETWKTNLIKMLWFLTLPLFGIPCFQNKIYKELNK